MTLDILNSLRDAMLDLMESTPGTTAHLVILTGSPPGIAAAESGSRLAVITLPSDWMAAASGGSKAKAGTWSGTATGAGTAGYWRLYNTGETTAYYEGTCGLGSGDLSLDNTNIAIGQTVTISTFTLNAGN